ncbi:MAG TPA: hypothetical protein VF429_06530, partial [Anaerolineae bacterium]
MFRHRFPRSHWLRLSILLIGTTLAAVGCAPTPLPLPTATPVRAVTLPPMTPRIIVSADTQATPTPYVTVETETIPRARETLAPPVSFLQQHIGNLFDLSRLPAMENAVTTQFTSRNWRALEHYFDYFIDDGNFAGKDYGYIDETGVR